MLKLMSLSIFHELWTHSGFDVCTMFRKSRDRSNKEALLKGSLLYDRLHGHIVQHFMSNAPKCTEKGLEIRLSTALVV